VTTINYQPSTFPVLHTTLSGFKVNNLSKKLSSLILILSCFWLWFGILALCDSMISIDSHNNYCFVTVLLWLTFCFTSVFVYCWFLDSWSGSGLVSSFQKGKSVFIVGNSEHHTRKILHLLQQLVF
jgi:hypothetical protein